MRINELYTLKLTFYKPEKRRELLILLFGQVRNSVTKSLNKFKAKEQHKFQQMKKEFLHYGLVFIPKNVSRVMHAPPSKFVDLNHVVQDFVIFDK